MELDDELKLGMATKLMDKSVATWWDNLKFHSTAPMTWNYLYTSLMSSITLTSIEIKKDKSFLNLSSLGRQ